MILTLIRHGESVWNRERRIQGSLDPELSPRGRRQADLLVAHLRPHLAPTVAAVYSSPLRRAAETATRIAEACGLPATLDPGLREIFLGEWEGKTVEEIRASFPGLYERWIEDPVASPAPGGEDLKAFEQRVMEAVQRMQSDHPGRDLIVVSHGGVIKTIICHALGLDVRHLFRLKQDNTAVNRLQLDGDRRRILLVNDTCHLDGARGVAPRDVLLDAGGTADPAF